jgi:hypothetical protein
MPDKSKEIRLTDKAKSKEFRYLSANRIRQLIKSKNWQSKGQDIFRVRGKSKQPGQPDLTVSILFKENEDHIIVITQKKKAHENN